MSLTASDIQEMVSHWLSCPPNGYLGSAYGSGVRELLQTPLAIGAADDLIAKLRQDVPILNQLPSDAINLYSSQDGADGMTLFFDIAGAVVPIVLPPATTN